MRRRACDSSNSAPANGSARGRSWGMGRGRRNPQPGEAGLPCRRSRRTALPRWTGARRGRSRPPHPHQTPLAEGRDTRPPRTGGGSDEAWPPWAAASTPTARSCQASPGRAFGNPSPTALRGWQHGSGHHGPIILTSDGTLLPRPGLGCQAVFESRAGWDESGAYKHDSALR